MLKYFLDKRLFIGGGCKALSFPAYLMPFSGKKMAGVRRTIFLRPRDQSYAWPSVTKLQVAMSYVLKRIDHAFEKIIFSKFDVECSKGNLGTPLRIRNRQ